MQCNCKCNSLVTSFPSHQVSISTHTHTDTHTHTHTLFVHFSVFLLHKPPPSVTSNQHVRHHRYYVVAGQCGDGSHVLHTNLHTLPTREFEEVGKVKCCGPIHTLQSLPDHGGERRSHTNTHASDINTHASDTHTHTHMHVTVRVGKSV
jgi:hypothetical protein